MIGAIIGDIVGSVYEFDNIKTKEFPLFGAKNRFTDDTVMSVAVCEALLDTKEYTEENVKKNVIRSMQKYGRMFPDAGYGKNFYSWIYSNDPQPYNSYGNGSAMRISSVGWLFSSIDETRRIARWTAEVTHNHTEGIKGAEAIASAIYLARNQATRDEIKKYVIENFGYDLNREINVIRYDYSYDVSCQGSVPEAILCFLESKDFEDCIRNAISIGGDSDTIAAIAGSIARAFYEVPVLFEIEAMTRLAPQLSVVVNRFNSKIGHRDPYFKVNDYIEDAIRACKKENNQQNVNKVLEMIRVTKNIKGRFLVPVTQIKRNGKDAYDFNLITLQNGQKCFVAFLSNEHLNKEKDKVVMSIYIQQLFDLFTKNKKVENIIINPWTDKFIITKQVVEAIALVDEKRKNLNTPKLEN